MFADPLTVVSAIDRTSAQLHAGTDGSLTFACTGRGPTSSTYRYDVSATHWYEVFVGHQNGRRNRSTIRFTESEVVADPIDTTKNSVNTMSAYVVIDKSLIGATSSVDSLLMMLASCLFDGSDHISSTLARRAMAGET
jgi:hypothetical protein